MKKILLVGGAGYIGTVLSQHLLSKGFEVKCFDALIYSQKDCIKSFIKKKIMISFLETLEIMIWSKIL